MYVCMYVNVCISMYVHIFEYIMYSAAECQDDATGCQDVYRSLVNFWTTLSLSLSVFFLFLSSLTAYIEPNQNQRRIQNSKLRSIIAVNHSNSPLKYEYV